MKDTDTGRRECRAVIVFHRHFDSEVTLGGQLISMELKRSFISKAVMRNKRCRDTSGGGVRASGSLCSYV